MLLIRFSITWFPVVFAFSFTKKELQSQSLTLLRERFEQLDVKLVTEYKEQTTHVVSKKRNTAKGLQALIHGKYIVNETFLDAITQAAAASDDSQVPEPSLLEQDFDKNWPDAAKHLPPPGGEPVQHPNSTYQPDPERKDVFDGYTFIFYDKAQYDTLLAPVTAGNGKALLGDVVPEETEVDEFVRYVKSVAGEKGLGAFDDGSEGKGVVLVRYLPSKGDLVQWYAGFITAVSLRLDHRPIEQSEFLEAILTKDASILRRSLEVESQQNTQEPQRATRNTRGSTSNASNLEVQSTSQSAEQSQAPSRTAKTRRPARRRFAGFDGDADVDMDHALPASTAQTQPQPEDEGGLFVSQDPDAPPATNQSSNTTRRSQRKRPASPIPEDDLMSGMAPSAARFKRQRLERGEDLSVPNPEPEEPEQTAQQSPPKKIKKEIDILAVAAQNREQEEARARAEKEDLANLPDDVDLSEIRRLNIVEEMEVRAPAQSRSREQDIADGRWNPKWNGMKNFKKFRRRGQVTGRQPTRVIVPLTQVKAKEFGVGDDYWLEDEDTQRKKKTASQPSGRQSQPSVPASAPASGRSAQRRVVVSESSEEEEETPALAPSRTRTTRAAATQSQSNTRSQSSKATSQGSKRAAAESAKEQPTKRPRPTRKVFEVADSDDSDDELKFRFGKRR